MIKEPSPGGLVHTIRSHLIFLVKLHTKIVEKLEEVSPTKENLSIYLKEN
jgi:hypothetical protein